MCCCCAAHVYPPSLLCGFCFQVHVELPIDYPYRSPSIGFMNKMFHPNVDEVSGSVCLDVINQTWSPMFDLINIFEAFLPQLLAYPNPSDPLNGEAAALALRDPDKYRAKIAEYIQKYASPEVVDKESKSEEDEEEDDDDLDDLSSLSDMSDEDETPGLEL